MPNVFSTIYGTTKVVPLEFLHFSEGSFGGSPRIHAGGGALQRSGKELNLIMRFSAGLEKSQGYRPFLDGMLFRWTEVQLPPAEAGGSHHESFPRLRPD